MDEHMCIYQHIMDEHIYIYQHIKNHSTCGLSNSSIYVDSTITLALTLHFNELNGIDFHH